MLLSFNVKLSKQKTLCRLCKKNNNTLNVNFKYENAYILLYWKKYITILLDAARTDHFLFFGRVQDYICDCPNTRPLAQEVIKTVE